MKYRHKLLGLFCVLAAITYLDRVAISVAGPRIQEDLGITPEMWGWVVGMFTISYALFEIPTGRMGDRLGARRVLTRIVVWWSAFTAFTGMTSNYYVLLLTRFLFGAGEAGYLPNVGIATSNWYPIQERARVMGTMLMCLQAGGAFAPLLIVPIQANFGWRASFFFLGALGILWSVVWYWWYRDTPAEKSGISPEEVKEIGKPPMAENHYLPWGLALRSGNLWAALIVAFCYVFALYFFISWLHTFLVKGRGFSENALLFSIFPPLLGAVGNILGGFTSDALVKKFGLKWGRRSIGVCSLICAAIFTAATIVTTNEIATLLFLGFVYAGLTFQQTVLISLVIDISQKYVGGILGLYNMVGNIGGFIFSVSFGYFVTWFGSYDLALIPVVGMLVIAAIAWLRLDATENVIPV